MKREIEFISHGTIQGRNEKSCEGELSPTDIYKKGRLVDREWFCDHCKTFIYETELVRRLEHVSTCDF